MTRFHSDSKATKVDAVSDMKLSMVENVVVMTFDFDTIENARKLFAIVQEQIPRGMINLRFGVEGRIGNA
jgi:hypothetical protein